jgi:hypothetical protein
MLIKLAEERKIEKSKVKLESKDNLNCPKKIGKRKRVKKIEPKIFF